MNVRDIMDIATANGWVLPHGWRVANEVVRDTDDGDVYEPVAEFAAWWMSLALRSLTLCVWVESEDGDEYSSVEAYVDDEADPFQEPGYLETMVNEALYEAQESCPSGWITRKVRP